MWDLPGPGLEPVSPALAGGFLTTEPPGKPYLFICYLTMWVSFFVMFGSFAYFFYWVVYIFLAFSLFLKIYFLNLLNLFLAVLGLRCCAQAFYSCGEQGLFFIVVHGLLIAVGFLVAEHGL